MSPTDVLTTSFEFMPGQIPEIDEPTRQSLAQLILDETIELPTHSRKNKVKYQNLSDDDFIALYQPLVDVLQLDPSKDPPPHRIHIARASKLGLTPSDHPIYERMDMSTVHTGLGFRAKFRFKHWALADYTKSGQLLARYVGGRPTREDITRAGQGHYKRLNPFPTVDNLKSRFGKISVFHEIIGYPSCKGWDTDDYLDWSYAFYMQNPGRELTARTIDGLSASGRGPSKQPIIKYFGSIANFKNISIDEFTMRQKLDNEARDERLFNVQQAAQTDPVLEELLDEAAGDQRRALQIAGQFVVASQFYPRNQVNTMRRAVLVDSGEQFIRRCIYGSPEKPSAAQVETTASALGVFDDIWPMYRFQNVDLALAA